MGAIGKQVAGAKMGRGNGSFAVEGLYDEMTVTDVSVFDGEENGLTHVVVELSVQKFIPRGDSKPEDQPPGSTVTWMQVIKPEIKKTILGNLKRAALIFIRQLARNAGQAGWDKIDESSVTEDVIDNHIFCQNSKLIGLQIAGEAKLKKKKKSDGFITLLDFKNIEPQAREQQTA